MFWHCQFKDLDESFQNPYSDLKKVQSASSYGRFIARKEFWPQCKVLCFGVLFCSVFLVAYTVLRFIPVSFPCLPPFSYLLILSPGKPKNTKSLPKASHKGLLDGCFPTAGFLRIPGGIQGGSTRDFRESSQPVLGGVWGGYCLVNSFLYAKYKDFKARKTLTRSTARRGSADWLGSRWRCVCFFRF